MNKDIKPIETIYKGYKFRSRLEARWAVFFDTLGIKWEYEKEGYDLDGVRYLPDFWLPQQDCFIEIKGQVPTEDEQRKARLLALSTEKKVYIFGSGIWIPDVDDTFLDHPYGKDGPEVLTKKGAYCYDPSDLTLSGDDPTSPCQKDHKLCTHGFENCPNSIYIEKGKGYDHLIRAIYLAEYGFRWDGDSCKLCMDDAGELHYFAPSYRVVGTKEAAKKGYPTIEIPLPQPIKQHEVDFKRLLLRKPSSWRWRVGALDGLYPQDVYRWCECPECGALGITRGGNACKLPCYQNKHSQEFLGATSYEDELRTITDNTPHLVAAYTAARQARFEHGEKS